ncbi:hypothetical protein NW768_004825 [Fusarium equiseti]|uniref:Uncharacterized protein n=1 Tax=Fusarium equiseti TaxID=61235 RepID=A0ABQ8RHB4_FUSEQ|nr:hypothetical protein NW768_004825 [Fusarium equiseti]
MWDLPKTLNDPISRPPQHSLHSTSSQQQPPLQNTIMSSSINPATREALESFIEHNLQRAEGDSGPLFGHIALPWFQLPGLPQAIHDLLPVDRTDTVFIYVNVDETEVLAEEDGQLPIERFSFDKFLRILRNNIHARGDFPWRETVNPTDWLEENILPPKAVVVMQTSPQISAECALALTCVVEWVCAEFPFERDIRLITMSPAVGQDLLLDLVSLQQDQPSVPRCDLASLRAKDLMGSCDILDSQSSEQIIAALHDIIKTPSANARLVLSFDERIDDNLSSLLGDEENEIYERFRVFAADIPSHIFQLAERATPGKTVVATVFGHFDHLPLVMDTFQELHLVLGRIDNTTPAWDNKSQQVVAYPHWTSKQDRTSQLWWAYQPEGVAVTVYSPKYTPEDFVRNGVSHVHLVQGAQFWGYVVAAIDLMSFGVGSNETIALFVQNPAIVEVIKAKLTRQTLISTGGLNLNTIEAKLFRDVLPKFDYDYRLAMLFALDCNPAVRRFKAYFIAVIIGSTPCHFKKSDITSQDVEDVFRASRGYGSSLVRYGTTWVNLGLVKLLCAVAMASGNTNQLTGIVRFYPETVKLVRSTYDNLIYAFQEHELHPGPLPFETAELGLSKNDKMRFHTDLFLAYMHQAILCHRPAERNDGNHEPEFTSLTSMKSCGFSLGTDVLSLLFNSKRVAREMGDEGWYGISHKLSRSSGSLTFHDWVVIPAEVIALWSEETGLTHADLASTVVHQTSNSIEVTDESSDTL